MTKPARPTKPTNATVHELIKLLNDRAAAGSPVKFWLRDDDAIQATPALDKLLELTREHSIPLTLAVIPANSSDELAKHLESTDNVAIAVHGWSHQNHAPASEKKQELGDHRPQSEILEELSRGLKLLSSWHGQRCVPLLVPPWNRVSTALLAELGSIGYQGISTFGDATPAPISVINTHIDIIDWKGTRGGRDPAELSADIIDRIKNSSNVIGILTHHLVHDEPAWEWLEILFSATACHAGCRWLSVQTLLQRPDPGFP